MLTPSLGKSPGEAVIWLLVAILAVWSTSDQYQASNQYQYQHKHKRNQQQHLYHGYSSSSGYSALRVGIMVEAHPYQPTPPAVDATADETRDFVESLFTAVALDDFGQSFTAALSDSLVWTVKGSSPIAATYSEKQFYIDKVLTPLWAVLVSLPVPIVEHIVVDKEWAVINWRSEGLVGK
ncbi:hypothetical protein LTR84_007711 [Exophiala bonariae]|uniref:Uncharacterized protein n=1 Tax=Exophiala bonariae TaxID=1690606 RepID=A0AAV9NNI6_9EURO|nr:hypothetical protein LTR84_007711 [Exophiala bonariae]